MCLFDPCERLHVGCLLTLTMTHDWYCVCFVFSSMAQPTIYVCGVLH